MPPLNLCLAPRFSQRKPSLLVQAQSITPTYAIARRNSFGIRTSAKSNHNSFVSHTSKFARLKALSFPHLQKKTGGRLSFVNLSPAFANAVFTKFCAVLMELTNVYLSLGSNVGDREANLRAAIAALPKSGVRVLRLSSIYDTEPVDLVEQPWFFNCVVEGETQLEPLALLRALQELEKRLGRTKTMSKGPRVIDIDILLYGQQTIDTAELHVPHPRLTQRRFVLAPLAEIAPQLTQPAWKGNANDLLAQTIDRSVVRRRGAGQSPQCSLPTK
jgi:2-amino-4-hydroxy-6-hydroxymethyldihydropteridine diphosphokinase